MPAINNDEFWYDNKTLRKPIKPLEVSKQIIAPTNIQKINNL